MRTSILAIAVIASLGLATSAHAQVTCNPLGPTSRVLQSPNPNDLHPDWTGESYIGTGWSVVAGDAAIRNGVHYLEGQLYSPRGGFQSQVYIIANEWACA